MSNMAGRYASYSHLTKEILVINSVLYAYVIQSHDETASLDLSMTQTNLNESQLHYNNFTLRIHTEINE